MTRPNYGGQAVIEGVMMSGPKGKAIAVRAENGELIYKIEEHKLASDKYPILKWPFIRGCVNFCRSMISGIKDLTWSAAQAGEEEDEKLSTKDLVFAVVTALLFTVVIFIVIPVAAGTWLYPYLGDFGRSLFEGLLRISLFLGYVLIISRMKDIQRVFAYHGAEHKTINAYEAGAELTPENVKKYSRIHCRCGTSFILMAMIVMIILFTFIGQTDGVHRTLIKIVMLPVVAGLSYELFRLPLKYPNNKIVQLLTAPGLAMQKLTTREPDLDQLEVAIAALTGVPGFEPNEAAPAKDFVPEEDVIIYEPGKKEEAPAKETPVEEAPAPVSELQQKKDAYREKMAKRQHRNKKKKKH